MGIGLGISVGRAIGMDVDSDMFVSINWGSF